MSFADNTFTPRRQRRTSDPEKEKYENYGHFVRINLNIERVQHEI